MKLFSLNSGKQVSIGDPVRTFRGDLCKLVDLAKPNTDNSTGRVYVQFDNITEPSCFFPAVIGCHFSKGY